MSVNYETRIVRGWRIPIEIADRINEITDYNYEDNFHRCNAYSDYDQWRYFGEEVDSIPCGWAESLSMILANTISTEEWDWDTIRQEVANDINCYNALSNEPNIYVMCCVL